MKIYVGIEQGSDAWLNLRLGRPTASNFHLIVTPKKCELSKSAHTYALRLCAERLLNATAESSLSNPWVERGEELEPLAIRQYEFQLDVQTIPVAFITTDDGSIGCSPDRLVVGEKRIGVEIKCASPHVHLGYLLDGVADDYRPQVMGQILVAELERVDLYSFHPQCPPALIQTPRDADYLAKLEAALRAFNETLAAMFERAKALGAFQPMARATTPGDVREIADLQKEFRIENERRFVKEGFTV